MLAPSQPPIQAAAKEKLVTFDALDSTAVIRMLTVYGHILACFMAASAIVVADLALFLRRRVDNVLLHKASNVVLLALAALWITGLVLIGLDTGFVASEIAAKPKLVAKIIVVSLLTLNGLALLHYAFPVFARRNANTRAAARMPTVLGAVSLVTWLYAAFLGLATPLAPAMGVSGFMAAYAVLVLVAIAVALRTVRPRLAMRLSSLARTRPAELDPPVHASHFGQLA